MDTRREAEIRETIKLMRTRLSKFNVTQSATRLSLAMAEDLLAAFDEARAEVERLRAGLASLLEASRPALRVLDKLGVDEWSAFDDAVTVAQRMRAEASSVLDANNRALDGLQTMVEFATFDLKRMEAERDEARAEVRVLLAEIDAERRERASAVLAAVEAAEERGAEWMLAHAQSEVWSKDDYGVQWQDVRSPSEICRDARGAGAEWQRDLDGCNAIIDRLKARLGDK